MNEFRMRFQVSLLRRALKAMPVVIVTGARQTGKTTLVRDLLKDTRRNYITLRVGDLVRADNP